jgi:Mn-containing catalase
MYLRIDKIPVDFPEPKGPSPNSAAAIQELLGGKFGEMSTLMNYTMQSFNFRGRKAARPFYDLIANIAAEELSHIETVSYAINLLLTGSTKRGTDPTKTPLKEVADARNAYHFLASAQAALPVDSMGNPWNGTYVFSSGNLKLDLLHNFFLECGARANKMRVYEMVDDPAARAAVGYLLVRGGVHVVAYARALEKLTGADLGKLFPIPDLSNKKFPEAKVLEDQGLHRIMYRFSPSDYGRIGEVWQGPHPEDGGTLEVVDGPPEGFDPPELPEEPQLNAPGLDPEFLAEAAKRVFGTATPAKI